MKGPKEGQRTHTKVMIFDAAGEVIQKVPEIWGGTVAKVAFTASSYFIQGTGAAGLKLNLDAVQIIELRQGGARSASDYGFGTEDGYTHSDTDTEDAEKAENTEGGGEGGTPDF